MATLSALTVMGLAASTLLSKVTQIGLETTHHKASRHMILRMSRALRTDVSTAESATIQDATELVLQRSGQNITYSIVDSPTAIRRMVHRKGEPVSTEQFDLPARCRPRFSESKDTVELQLTAPGSRNPWTIEAVKEQ
jgi:hypothetical protein